MNTLLNRFTLAACGLSAVMATPAQAAIDMFLRLDGIQGESRDVGATAQWQWSRATVSGSFNPFVPVFTGGVFIGDDAADGRWTSFGLSVFATPEGTPGEPPILRYELQNVRVSSYSLDGSGSASTLPWLALSDFSAATMTWRPLLADGSRGTPLVGHWDLASGRFEGDPGVVGAFDALGVERWHDGTLVLTSAVPEPASWALWLLGAGLLAQQLRRVRG
jgi:hypothetical protein